MSLTAFIGEQKDDLAVRRAARAARVQAQPPVAQSGFDSEEDPIGKALIGLDGRYLRVNPALCRMTGYSEEQLRELTPFSVTHPNDVTPDRRAMDLAIIGRQGNYRLETRYLTAAGGYVWVLKFATLITDAEGNALHFVSAMRNIDDRKKQENSLTGSVSCVSSPLQVRPARLWTGQVERTAQVLRPAAHVRNST